MAPSVVLGQSLSEPPLSVLDKKFLATNTISNFEMVNDGILRGGLPSQKDLTILARSGVRTVIDLRGDGSGQRKEEQLAYKLGLKYIHVPMGFSDPDRDDLSKVLSIMVDRKMQPVFVHCRQGADRTGIAIGIYRQLVDRWDFDKTYAEMRRHHFKPVFQSMKAAVKSSKDEPRLTSVLGATTATALPEEKRAAF